MSRFQAWRRVFDTNNEDSSRRLTRKRDLFLAFAIVSLPLLAIALLLIGFIFNTSERQRPDRSVETPELPIVYYDTKIAYYTGVNPGPFLLLGSWASNIAEIVVAPFMVIFSYAVAREVLQGSIRHGTTSDIRPPFLSEIIRGGHVGLWHWVKHIIAGRSDLARQDLSALRVVNVAGFGLLTASVMTLLVIVGDNWLHATTYATQIRHYEPVNKFSDPSLKLSEIFAPATLNFSDNVHALSQLFGSPGFSAIDLCDQTLQSPLPANISSAPLPCSLGETNGTTNIWNPEFVYQTLDQGLSQINSSFNRVNFTSLDDAELNGEATPYQIVTTLHDGNWHAIFFNPNSAQELDLTDYGHLLGPEFGIDYVAKTTSMVTQCTMATSDCGITAKIPGSTNREQNNLSIPFHCYDGFSGNLGQTPATGHERAQGWNMSFYEINEGRPRNIPVQSQSNPFNFYVVTAVNSIDLQDFQDPNAAQANLYNGSLVEVGGGFSAFALNCEATIYDISFSLVNGSFFEFNATKASDQLASIIKAPLQVGFGQYHLYEAAYLAIIPKDKSINETMSTSFSQTGMALASGAFDFDVETASARLRWTVPTTVVYKAPFWFLVITCLVYSVFGFIMTIVAFLLRRTPEIRDQQSRLVAEWGPEFRDTVEKKEKKGRSSSRRDLLDFMDVSN